MGDLTYVLRFNELGIDDVARVGGKNASLGEMYRTLSGQGGSIPNGFATTARAYRDFLEHNDLEGRIRQALDVLDVDDVDALSATGASIRDWIMAGELPAQLVMDIQSAYQELAGEYDHQGRGDQADGVVEDHLSEEEHGYRDQRSEDRRKVCGDGFSGSQRRRARAEGPGD